MKQETAIKYSLTQEFWSIYPLLTEDQTVSFEILYANVYEHLSSEESNHYKQLFFDLVQDDELPLIPIIPVDNEELFSLEYL